MRLRNALPAFVLLGAVAWILIMGKSIVIDESFLRRQLRAVPHVLEQRCARSNCLTSLEFVDHSYIDLLTLTYTGQVATFTHDGENRCFGL